jgi:predicted KAP-like P-loop ATPase
LYEISTEISALLGKLFIAVGSPEVRIWRRLLKVFVINIFYLLVVLMSLWTDVTVERFLFMLHHQEALLSAGLLNSLKEQEMCGINV